MSSANHKQLPWWVFLLIPLTALHALVPMWRHGFSCGHDLTFHLTSWFDCAQQWRHGILYPRWATDPNYTAGEPRFLFYSPASWMLGAALGSLFGWTAAPFVYIFVVLCAAGAAMYRLARLVLWPAASLAAALLYMANPYMLFVAYTRSAFSEMLAAAILPLLFLAVLRPRIHIALLAEVVAALWLTNAPAAVIAMYSLLVLAVLSAWRHRNLPNLWRTAAGTALGMGIAAIYILPAAYERKWVQIIRVRSAYYDFHNNFLFARTSDPLHDAVLRHASVLAVFLIAVIAASTALLLLQRRHWHTLQNRVFFTLAILAGIILFLMLPISEYVWKNAPEIAFLQFPWRWLIAAAPIAALLVAALLGRSGRRRVPIGIALVLSIFAVAAGHHLYFQPCDAEDTPRSVIAQLRSGIGQEGTDEYTPIGADPDDLQPAAPRVWLYPASEIAQTNPNQHHELPQHAQVNEWSAQRKSFSADLAQPAVAILQTMDYPAWRIHLNGQPAQKSAPASSGQIQILLPAGHTDADLRFVHTIDRILADCISALSLVLLAFVTWRERKHHVRAP